MAAAKSKKKKTPQKVPQKTALSWEELLIEKVLARIKETDRQINESAGRFEQKMKEKGRQINESAGRFEQKMKESAERPDPEMMRNAEQPDWKPKGSAGRTGREIKKIDRWIDRHNRFIEDSIGYIDLPNLMQKFNELGFVFERAFKDATINDKKNRISIEIGITLESGDKVMIVETKAKPTTKDITGHIKQMREMRRYGDLHGEKRKYLGAIFGIDFNDKEKLFAIKNGFYVIEPSEETFIITAPKGVYSP